MTASSPSSVAAEHSLRIEPGKAGPLTVLQVLPRLDLGGVERGAVEIARAVVEAGGRALVAAEPGGRLANRLESLGATVCPGPYASKNPITIWRNAGRLARLAARESVSVIHARSRAPAWSALLAARRTGLPLVTTWHGVYGENGPFKRRYNSVMARGDRVIAISEFIAETARRYGVSEERLVLIPRGAEMSAFSDEMVGAERAIATATAFRVVEDSRAIAMLPGRLSPWKGQEDFIDALALLEARRGPDFLGLIVGDGPAELRRALEARIAEKRADGVVRMVGACDDMPAALKLASVVVSASTEPEAFGRIAVEAQAMGRPIIATDHGGARETVEHGRTGWLYPPGDAAALADAIETALALDPSERAHMGMAGRARVANRFSVAAMQRATLAVYEELTGRSFGARI